MRVTNHTSVGKAPQTNVADSTGHPARSANAVALVPPDYGIDFVDSGMAATAPVQRVGKPEEEEPLPRQFAVIQGRGPGEVIQEKQPPSVFAKFQPEALPPTNGTSLPDGLKTGIESLSGISMDSVKVHYNSSQPAQLKALAYAQGSDIHVAPGQEQHLPHEAWHIVQQAQGRVKPTMQMKDGVRVNDDEGLEHEADVMGTKALQLRACGAAAVPRSDVRFHAPQPTRASADTAPIQRRVGFEFEIGDIATQHWGVLAGWHDHAKGAVLSQLTGYKLTADEGQGNSQLEVIIDPIDETNPADVVNLATVTGPAVVATIDSIALAAFNAWTRADQIVGLNGSSWDRYRSGANGAAGIMGQLQMTGGIDMNKLHAHVTGAQATNYLATLNPMANQDDATVHNTLNAYTLGPIAGHATNTVNGIFALAGLTQPQRNQIAAVAALMATFPINMRTGGALPYPKAAAGPMLARTDFSRIMMALPDAAKNVLTPAIMRTIVLATINAVGLPGAPVAGADPVIPVGANLPPTVPALNQLSINAWVGDVVPTPGLFLGHWQGSDRLTRRNFPGTAQQGTWLESMGSYGSRVDPGNRPILEFRSLAGVFVNDLPGQLQRLADFLNHP